MNVRIFRVNGMECLCAQTRPRYILSSERVIGNGVRTHVITVGSKVDQTHNATLHRINACTFSFDPVAFKFFVRDRQREIQGQREKERLRGDRNRGGGEGRGGGGWSRGAGQVWPELMREGSM